MDLFTYLVVNIDMKPRILCLIIIYGRVRNKIIFILPLNGICDHSVHTISISHHNLHNIQYILFNKII